MGVCWARAMRSTTLRMVGVSSANTSADMGSAVVGAGIAAGTVLYAGAIPSEGNAYAKFLGIVQTTGVAAVTAGAVSAFLVRNVAKWKAYDAPFQL